MRLERFAADFDGQRLASISARDIDDWLRALPVGGVTRNSFRRRLSTLFSYARRRGYVQVNPIEDVERAKERHSPIGILTVEQTESLLRYAQPEMLPFWAVGAFAGLRTAEIQRLSWNDIDLPAGLIEVKAEKSKTANRRLVTIQPNLRKWLETFHKSYGPVTPTNFQARAKQDRDFAGLARRWPNNALRHSFASYHLAVFNDAAKLALEMGNSPRIIFDRIGGSGVFARDPDSILTMTAHEEPEAFTVEATLRNFAPIEPFVVKWEWPLFKQDDELNPEALKQARTSNTGQFKKKYSKEQVLDQLSVIEGHRRQAL